MSLIYLKGRAGKNRCGVNRHAVRQNPVPVGHYSRSDHKPRKLSASTLASYLSIGSDHINVDIGGEPVGGLKGGL